MMTFANLWESEKKRVLCQKFLGLAHKVFCMLDYKSTVSEFLVMLEQHFGDLADGFELYSQFRAASLCRKLHRSTCISSISLL